MLQAGRSRFQIPVRLLDFSIELILPALGSTQPLTEMSTRNLPEGKGRPARKADNLNAVCEPIGGKMWEPRRLTTLGVCITCHRDSFTFNFTYKQRPVSTSNTASTDSFHALMYSSFTVIHSLSSIQLELWALPLSKLQR
jgi:hypothetical protein